MKPFFLNDAQGVLVFRLDKQCCLLLLQWVQLCHVSVYPDSEVLIQDRNSNVNGKVQELVELKPLPAVEEPTAAGKELRSSGRVRNMNLTTPCQLTGHI